MVELKKQIAGNENMPVKYKIRLPLRLALTIPFVIIILATVGLTGYLAFENGQTVVNDLVTQLFSKIEASIDQHLDNYLGAPFIINQINLNAMQQGQLNGSDTEQMAQYFWQQGQLFSEVESMGFANNDGEFAAANHPEKYMIITDPSPTGIVLRRYAVGNDGRRTGNIRSEMQNFDVHAMGWYQTAVKAGQPAWTDINPALTGPRLIVTAVTPYYDQESSLAGVFYLDVSLAEINQFLRNINISRRGQIFIMEPGGFIVASSTPEQPYSINGDKIERLNASSSSEPLIAYAAMYLKEQFTDPGKISIPYQSTFSIQGERHFVRVTSYRDARGLDWRIVLVVPESDFMAQITLNNRNTLVLIMVSFLLSIIVAALLARRITHPLSHLSRSAKALAQGDYDQKLSVNSGDEVGELTDAFNTMAVQLRENLASLRESEERFRALVEQAPEAILVLDCDNFLFVDANKKAEELFGCSREELRKSGPQQFYTSHQPEKTVRSMQENIDRALEGGLVSFERHVQSSNGKEHLCEVWLTRLPSADRKLVRISYIDITQRKRAEEELGKYREHLEELVKERTALLTTKTKELTENQSTLMSIVEELNRTTAELVIAKERAETADMLKSVFLATMSHELRTPLNSIIGFTGIMLQGLSGPINDEQVKQLEMVKGSANHLLALINDVLDISKIEAGQFKIYNAPFEMKKAIETVVQLVTPLAEKKGLSLHMMVAPQVSTIVSDRRRVEQILFNHLSNAIKFTEKGEIKVECQVSEGQIITRVIDTGIGIKPEHMDTIFKPFTQLENGLTRRFEGTGLGLSINKKLVEMLGGRISAESEYGKGSVFTFTLPLIRKTK